MNIFNIKKVDNNMEVLSKIADSLVKGYGYNVKYNLQTGEPEITGGNDCRALLKEELANLFEKYNIQ